MPMVKIGDINMYYEIQGKGDPLILLHALGLDGTTCFFRQIPGLAKEYRVIAIDNRGSGRSDKPSIPYSMDMMAKDAAELLGALDIRKAHIYGISMGGMIAQHMALCYPQLTATLVLAGTNCGGSQSAMGDPAVLAALFDMQGTPEERSRRLVQCWFSQGFPTIEPDVVEQFLTHGVECFPPAHAFMRQSEAILMHDTYERLPEIGVPALVIGGGGDGLMPVDNSRTLASRIPGAELVTLQGKGHLISVEAPEAVNRVILDFLKRHPMKQTR